MPAQESRLRCVDRNVTARLSNSGEGRFSFGNAQGGWKATRLFFALALAAAPLAACGGGVERPSPAPAPTASEPAALALDPLVPPSDPRKYAAVESPAEWKNPFLIVAADGVEIRSGGERPAHVSVDTLPAALVALPVSAWPYGRVVAARPRESANETATEVEARVDAALEPLGVVVEWWPSE
jgi:hypothetical protein